MGLTLDHALGRNARFYASRETTPGTFLRPVGTNACKILKSQFDKKIDRLDRKDARQTRSLLERYTGKRHVAYSLESYLLASGAAGTAPDLGELYRSALGIETINGGVSAVYTLSKLMSDLGTNTLMREFNSIWSEMITGAWVEGMKISQAGGDAPMVAFDGGGFDLIETGFSTLNGATAGSTATVQTADGPNFAIGSILQIGAFTNGGIGSAVTADAASPAFTVEGTPGASNGAAVQPFVPAEVTAGSPISGTLGSLTVDGATLLVLSWELNLKNGLKEINDEAFQAGTTDVIPSGWRGVSGQFIVRAKRDTIIQLARRRTFTQRNLQITCGNVAGSRCVIGLPNIEHTFAPAEVPESEEATFPLPWVALSSGSGEAELSLTFN